MEQLTAKTLTIHSSGRKTYIDTARGIGIILLVLGHIVRGNSYLFNWIFSFHMPLFFFLSGMCVREEKLAGPSTYLLKKLKSRMLPYFIITAAGFLICMMIPSYREPVLADGLRLQLTCTFLWLKPRNLYIGQVWFLASLFWSEVYFYIWYKLFGKRHIIVQLVTILLFAIAANNLWRIQIPHFGRLPFNLDTAVMGAFCYALGYLTERYQLMKYIRKYCWLLLFPLLACNIYFGTWLNGYVNMCDLIYGNLFYYLIAMTAGIVFTLLLSWYIQKLPLLSWYGKYSLPLFAAHTFLIYLVREWVYLATGTYYTMMADVPDKLAFIMTFIILLLFLPVGKLYQIINTRMRQRTRR